MTRILAVISILLCFTISNAYAQMSWWSVAFPAEPQAQLSIQGNAAQLANMLDLPGDASFHQKTDAVRHFIQKNSVHDMDEEFYTYWGKIPVLMQKLFFNASGAMQDKPHMECATRSAVMYHILKTMGIRSRPVVGYKGDDVQDSHTFLEVYNPDTQKWEIQDPDRNFYWMDRKTGERASIADLVSKSVRENFLPCADENNCTYEGLREDYPDYYALAAIIDFEAQYNPLLVNTDAFNMDDPFLRKENPMAYCSLFAEGKCHSELIKMNEEESANE